MTDREQELLKTGRNLYTILHVVMAELQEHNKEYHHVTDEATMSLIKEALNDATEILALK